MRRRIEFWLDDENEDHRKVSSMVRVLKAHKMFAPTVRDGIRLIVSLRSGSTAVLKELFPGIYEMMRIDILETVLDSLLAENKRLREENERLRAGQFQREQIAIGESSQLQIVKDDETGSDTAQNLLNSMAGFWS